MRGSYNQYLMEHARRYVDRDIACRVARNTERPFSTLTVAELRELRDAGNLGAGEYMASVLCESENLKE